MANKVADFYMKHQHGFSQEIANLCQQLLTVQKELEESLYVCCVCQTSVQLQQQPYKGNPCVCVSLHTDKSDDPDKMDDRTRQEVLRQLHMVHVKTGHPSNQALARVLRNRGCSKAVQKLALNLICDPCLEHKSKEPVSHANLDSDLKLRGSLGLDVAEF